MLQWKISVAVPVRRIRTVAVTAAFLGLLAACGQRGPLFLPDHVPARSAAEAPRHTESVNPTPAQRSPPVPVPKSAIADFVPDSASAATR